MSARSRLLLAALAIVIGGCGSSSSGPAGAPSPDRPVQRPLGATPAGERVGFSLVLRERSPGALERYLQELYDPSSPNYRHFLSATALGARFGLSDRELGRVRGVLEGARLHVIQSYPQRTSFEVAGAAADVNRFFSTRLVNYRDPQGRPYHAPLRSPVIPASIAHDVLAANGLSNRIVIHPAAVPAGGLKPAALAAAYDVTALHDQGLLGQGQTVAILSLDAFKDSDVAGFDAAAGITGAPPVEHVPVLGGTQPGDGQDEVNLDVDAIRGLAPKAQILDYEAGKSIPGFAPIVNKVVADGRAKILSMSWGLCELAVPAAAIEADARAFEAAAASGVTVFVATGDSGAYTCQEKDPADHRLSVDYPADSPFVVGVGGTTLDVRTDGSYLREYGWEEVLGQGGAGGGVSTLFRQPSWQQGAGVQNQYSNGMRQVPDVAGDSDPASGVFVYYNGQGVPVGGTSAAAPFWSGSMVLIQQLAAQQHAGPLGFVAPMLYRAAASSPSSFHDVAGGGNRHYDSVKGWDYATGLGTPDVALLAKALIAQLKHGKK